MRIIERRELEEMPFDHNFYTDNGNEICHATGDEIRFEDDDTWWNEYEDADGELHYGR